MAKSFILFFLSCNADSSVRPHFPYRCPMVTVKCNTYCIIDDIAVISSYHVMRMMYFAKCILCSDSDEQHHARSDE